MANTLRQIDCQDLKRRATREVEGRIWGQTTKSRISNPKSEISDFGFEILDSSSLS